MTAQDTQAEPYDAVYYATHCGTIPYERSSLWLGVFGNIADQLIRAFAPRRVFDAGCALGMLVESFWDRSVEAYGRDISEFAIASVRSDMRSYCSVGTLTEPIDGKYDLLTCIEVLEHMPADEAEQAVRVMADASERILFSSSPIDFDEPTHVNVRPTSYWLQLWAKHGFAPNIYHDAGYVAPHAFVLERSEEGRTPRELAAFADRIRHRIALVAAESKLASVRFELAEAGKRVAELQADLAAKEQFYKAELEAKERSLDGIVQAKVQALADVKRAAAQAAEQHAQSVRNATRDAAKLTRELTNDLQEARSRATANERLLIEARASAGQMAQAQDEAVAKAVAEAEGLRRMLRHADAQTHAIRSSTSWKVTAPLRRVLALIPGGVTRSARVGIRYTKAMARLRGGEQFRTDRLARQTAVHVKASPLFDAEWYLNRYPDVAIARIDPALHYSLRGEAEGRDAGPRFSAQLYGQLHPEARASGLLLLHADRHGWSEPPPHGPAELAPITTAQLEAAQATHTVQQATVEPENIPDVDDLVGERYFRLRPLAVFAVPHAAKRLSVVTDSINAGSLYGGVGTAIVLAALVARRIGATLRIITRTEIPVVDNLASVLAVQGIEWDGNVDFVHAPWDGSGPGVPIGSGDLFITTSWWTTWATRLSVPRSRITYLLQEDERMFYPLDDDHLRCTETLRDPDLLYIVNSELLLSSLRESNLAPGGVAFEPSFPAATYYAPQKRDDGARRRFFFYARPGNPRNLYWRGLEALSGAIEAGVLNPTSWDFYFAGQAAHQIRLPGGTRPTLLDRLSWPDYVAEVRQMDLGLSLMYTPHPSYPPLDLAACGAVVVTSRFGPKQSLDRYCPNILCVEPDLKSLISALGEGAALAADLPRRQANFAQAGLGRDWSRSAAAAIDRVAAWAEQVRS